MAIKKSPNSNKLSIVIIVKDEERMLTKCIESVHSLGETLVLDTGSTDKTVSLAKRLGVKVKEYKDGKNFSDWRNEGVKLAQGEWIFYLDADERVSDELRNEINEVIRSSSCTAYAIPRRNFVMGKELRHGGWYPDYQKRLFKKSEFEKWHGELHEEPTFKGPLGHLKSPLIHQKHETFAQMVEKTNSWSEVEAKLMYDSNHPPMNIRRFLSAMSREFFHRMILKRAFLDGKVGISFAMYQVFSRFVSYAKLWEMQIKNGGQ